MWYVVCVMLKSSLTSICQALIFNAIHELYTSSYKKKPSIFGDSFWYSADAVCIMIAESFAKVKDAYNVCNTVNILLQQVQQYNTVKFSLNR